MVRDARVRVWLTMMLFAATAVIAQEPVLTRTAEEVESVAQNIDRRLMAPCCNVNTLDIHDSGVSREMRDEIRLRLRQGETEDAILAVFVERYGPSVLAVPDSRGVALLAYLAPVWMSAIGILLMGYLIWRWQRGNRSPLGPLTAATPHVSQSPFVPDTGAPDSSEENAVASASSATDPDADYKRRVEQKLEELDR